MTPRSVSSYKKMQTPFFYALTTKLGVEVLYSPQSSTQGCTLESPLLRRALLSPPQTHPSPPAPNLIFGFPETAPTAAVCVLRDVTALVGCYLCTSPPALGNWELACIQERNKIRVLLCYFISTKGLRKQMTSDQPITCIFNTVLYFFLVIKDFSTGRDVESKDECEAVRLNTATYKLKLYSI